MYKKSRYNIIKKPYIYNLLKKSHLELNDTLLDYLDVHEDFSGEEFPIDILKKLIEYKIITKHDELQIIDNNYNSIKYGTKGASFIIYPTLACNFSCNYCFETVKVGHFDNSKEIYIKKFLQKQIAKLDSINIRWSGGEPLLVWNSIKEISKVLIESEVKVFASMATNGYLISEKVLNEMVDCKISLLHITIDGTRDEHNIVRFTDKDKSTYDKIIRNIKSATKYLRVAIRLNVSKNNMDSFEKFLFDLEKEGVDKNNIEIYVKPIRLKQGCLIDNSLLTEDEFMNQELKYLSIANKMNFNYSFHPNYNSYVRCIYHKVNSFAIDPNLNLYKCAEHIGLKKFIVGKINSNSEVDLNNSKHYNDSLLYSPLFVEECKECKVLPICYGKCPVIWEQNEKKTNEGCIPEKTTISKKIIQIIENDKY